MDRQYYLWSAGGATVSAELSTQFINRLREVIGSAGETEIGGLLLGRRESDDRITIEDFDLLPSEHRRGVTFTLSQADRRKLTRHMRAKHNGLETVGTFRTHLRQGLYMDQYDSELMSGHFAGASDVMLLIRPWEWVAGIFVWEQGDIHRQKSYLEFPFDAAQLPLTTEEVHESAAVTASRTVLPAWLTTSFHPNTSTVMKFALLAATIGLVAVLAHYSHGRNVRTVEVPVVREAPVSSSELHRPVDPDVSRSDVEEMRVKLPDPDSRPSPFAAPNKTTVPASTAPSIRSSVTAPGNTPQVQVLEPPVAPPVQMAGNVPALPSGSIALRPEPPQLISMVSVYPAQPGTLSRGINKIPILSLLHRNKYKAGERFSPARPIRQVRPRLSAEWALANGGPTPVDVKVWVDEHGRVTRAQPLSGESESPIADVASNAAMKWTFEPAKVADRPVSSELVMHFRFAPRQVY